MIKIADSQNNNKPLPARECSIYFLKLKVKPRDKIYTVMRHRSKSGQSRFYEVYALSDNELHRLTWHVAKIIDYRYDHKYEAVLVNGCNFSGPGAIAEALGWELFKNESAIKACPL